VFFCNGKKHDFRLLKESGLDIAKHIQLLLDSGFVGIEKLHENSVLPVKKRKKQKRSNEKKRHNRSVSSQRVTNEHGIGFIKRFKILSERYRNRRKRFALRFNLLAGLCNFDMKI